jgi:predicted Zn-ribbon and HTH transcriptional regulator
MFSRKPRDIPDSRDIPVLQPGFGHDTPRVRSPETRFRTPSYGLFVGSVDSVGRSLDAVDDRYLPGAILVLRDTDRISASELNSSLTCPRANHNVRLPTTARTVDRRLRDLYIGHVGLESRTSNQSVGGVIRFQSVRGPIMLSDSIYQTANTHDCDGVRGGCRPSCGFRDRDKIQHPGVCPYCPSKATF